MLHPSSEKGVQVLSAIVCRDHPAESHIYQHHRHITYPFSLLQVDYQRHGEVRPELIPHHQIVIARFAYHEALNLSCANHPIPPRAINPSVTCRAFAG